MGHRIESDFVHHYRCIVAMTPMGHRCGYVGIPKTHPLHGLNYSDTSPYLLKEDVEDEDIGKRGMIPLLIAGTKRLEKTLSIDVYFNVHGSVTYAGGHDYPVENPEGLWWFGYDCSHFDDKPDLEEIENPIQRAIMMDMHEKFPDHGTVRTKQFCENECRNLAEQLLDIEKLANENVNMDNFLSKLTFVKTDVKVELSQEVAKEEE